MTTSDYKQTVEKLSFKMFNIHTSMIIANEKITKLTAKNSVLSKKNEQLELQFICIANLTQR